MNRGYYIGVSIGVLLIIAAVAAYAWLRPPPPMNVAFTTDFVDRSETPLSYGHRDEVGLKLENRGQGRVRVDAVQFSVPFVTVAKRRPLPLWIPARSAVVLPVEIVSEPPHWGQQKVQVTAIVTNRKDTHEVQTLILWDLAAHINADPPLVEFPRVKRTENISAITVQLWHAVGDEPPEDVQVESLDPAVRVTSKPIQFARKGHQYLLELSILVDASLAQPQHKSQIVVRTNGDAPPLIIPVVGWVDD